MRKYVLSLLLLFSACTSSTSVYVDSYSDVAVIPRGFGEGSLFAIVPKVHANELFGREVAQNIRTVLEQRGYVVVDSDKADYILNFDVKTTKYSRTVMVKEEVPGVPVKTKEWVKDKDGKWDHKETFQVSSTFIEKPVVKTYYMEECEISVLLKETSKPVWNGTASCEVYNQGDMRARLEYLLMPLLNYFGQSTKREITLNLKEKDLDSYRQ